MRFRWRFSRGFFWLLSLLITLLIAWFLVPRLDLRALRLAIARLDWSDSPLLLLFWLSGVLARTRQLQLLLPVPLRFAPLTLIILVRNFVVDILPAHTLSLFSHTVMLRRHGVDTAVAGASFAVSTVLNAMSMVVMLLPALLVVEASLSIAQFLAATVLLLALGLGFLRWGGQFGRLMAGLPWPTWHNWGGRWQAYFSTNGSLSRLILPFMLGFASRLCKYLLLFGLFSAFCGLDFELGNLPAFFVALSGAELSTLLPIAGLAGFGTWELTFVLMAGLLKLQTATPLEIGLLIHVLTQVWEALWAAAALILFRSGRGGFKKP